MSRKRLTALIDADVLLYHVVEDALVEEPIRETDEWHYVVDMVGARAELCNRLTSWAREAGCGGLVACLGSASNWRKRVHPAYKRHRSRRKPLGYVELERWLVEDSAFETAVRMHLEADDVIGLAATNRWYGDAVMVSNDKDLLSVPGALYNPVTGAKTRQDDDAAFVAHMTQTLAGDAADGYSGAVGFGPVKASATIAAALSSGRAATWRAVVAAFEGAGQSEEEALMNARVARILQGDDYVDRGPRRGRLRLWEPPR